MSLYQILMLILICLNYLQITRDMLAIVNFILKDTKKFIKIVLKISLKIIQI